MLCRVDLNSVPGSFPVSREDHDGCWLHFFGDLLTDALEYGIHWVALFVLDSRLCKNEISTVLFNNFEYGVDLRRHD
jgi:hypothetical protein